MKLSQWAKKVGISYRRAWQLFKEGKIPNAYRLPTGTIIVKEDDAQSAVPPEVKKTAAVYCLVADGEDQHELERQIKRLKDYASEKGYTVKRVVKEVGVGADDTRPKLIGLLKKRDYGILLAERKSKIASFGFNYVKLLAEEHGKEIECLDDALPEDRDEVIKEFRAVVRSFMRKLYDPRTARGKTDRILRIVSAAQSDSSGRSEE